MKTQMCDLLCLSYLLRHLPDGNLNLSKNYTHIFLILLKCPYYAIFKVANIVLWVS